MTKREFIARIGLDPIVIEPVCTMTCYRIALHGDPDPNSGVWIALAPVAGTLLVEDFRQVHAVVGGRTTRLTSRETEAVVSRLRRLVGGGGLPKSKPPMRREPRTTRARRRAV